MSSKKLTCYLGTRVSQSTKDKFRRVSRQYGDPGLVLRELIEAFVENRVSIEPAPTRKPLEKLYNEH